MINRILGSAYGRLSNAYYAQRYNFYRSKYEISNDFGFNGTDIRIYGNGRLVIKTNSYIGSYSTLQIGENCLIQIRSHCLISHNVSMYTSSAIPDHDFRNTDIAVPQVEGNIIIGDGVWIGANVFINPGITIGNNAVAGANAVLTKDVPENSIVGGVPAKLIRYKTI